VDAVDLYIDVPAPGQAGSARALPGPAALSRSAAATSMVASITVPPHPLAGRSDAPPGLSAAPHFPGEVVTGLPPASDRAGRLVRLLPYAIVAVAVGAGILVAGGSMLWPRSTLPPRSVSLPALPPDNVPPAPPARVEADGRGQPIGRAPTAPRAAQPTPGRGTPAVPGDMTPNSRAAGPGAGAGPDAAADAALEAAARLLATPPRPAPAGASAGPRERRAAGTAASSPR
jgi:hypothetical protein